MRLEQPEGTNVLSWRIGTIGKEAPGHLFDLMEQLYIMGDSSKAYVRSIPHCRITSLSRFEVSLVVGTSTPYPDHQHRPSSSHIHHCPLFLIGHVWARWLAGS